MAIVLTVLAVAALLLISEYWWRKHPHPNELSRKFVHITVGSFVAFWPLYLGKKEIIWLGVAFIVGIAASKVFGIFKAIHSVQRPTWGEIFFALAVVLVAWLSERPEVFTVAILQMSLADGLAAVIGTRWGAGNRYNVMGSTKSIVGSVTFFLVSLAILIAFVHLTPITAPIAYLIAIAGATTLLENVGAFGLDNLFVPLMVLLALGR